MTPNRTHDISNTPYHVKDIEAFGDILNNAATAAFPNRGQSRYKEVHALLLSWEDDNLGVINEVTELDGVFRDLYSFETEEWKIPSDNNACGHGQYNSALSVLKRIILPGFDTEKRDSPKIQWFGLQTMLEQAKADVLLLLDCCAAASSATGSGNGVTEIIAACGFEAWAPGVGQHSFTRSLIDELKYLHRGSPFSTSFLHNKVLSRVKYWKPRYAPEATHHEMRKSPIYIVVLNETRPRSIVLESLKQPFRTNAVSKASSSSSLSPAIAFSSLSSCEGEASTAETALESSNSSIGDVWPDGGFSHPKVLISVALEEEQWLSPHQWTDWMRSIPALVKQAKVEGVYKSDSTLLLVSLPIAVWNLVPPHPAILFVGFLRSQNLLTTGTTISPTDQAHMTPEDPNLFYMANPSDYSTKTYARALCDYKPKRKAGLQFGKGDMILVAQRLGSGWWNGLLGGTSGWFPGACCEVVIEGNAAVKDGQMEASEVWIQHLRELLERFQNRNQIPVTTIGNLSTGLRECETTLRALQEYVIPTPDPTDGLLIQSLLRRSSRRMEEISRLPGAADDGSKDSERATAGSAKAYSKYGEKRYWAAPTSPGAQHSQTRDAHTLDAAAAEFPIVSRSTEMPTPYKRENEQEGLDRNVYGTPIKTKSNQWWCSNCLKGPMTHKFDVACVFCHLKKGTKWHSERPPRPKNKK
ncbi:MAG: hypothetical protein Q9191_007989 [Dirinaria sp. TL-2023a]